MTWFYSNTAGTSVSSPVLASNKIMLVSGVDELRLNYKHTLIIKQDAGEYLTQKSAD
jgi:hypothetical protein